MKPLENIDRWIGRSLEKLSAQLTGGQQPKESLEIRREILNEIRDRIEPRGGGEYLFPYQEVLVHIHAEDEEQQQTFEAVFLDQGGLEEQVREMLSEAGCPGQVALTVQVTVEPGEPYRIEYRRVPKGEAVAPNRPVKHPEARIQVLQGAAEKSDYVFVKDVIHLGRLKEVVSRDGGVRRRNDVAFDDGESTISREHAHIAYESGKYRLYHDSGERPTRLFRDGRVVPVPANGRGAQLRSGDEIHLGAARLQFEIAE